VKKVMADTVGVFEVASFGDCQVVSQKLFLASLKSLSDGETIGAELDADMAKKIDAEYGIKSRV
jgi:hypothetical protein